jgi:hypothetical protein
MKLKYGQILVFVLVGVLTAGSLSVMGLLQSTERIGTSGLIVRPVVKAPIVNPPSYTYTPPPPEPTIEIDVYSNQECTDPLSDVEWGEIEAGETSNEDIYVKNNGDTSVSISLITENWSSNTAENNLEVVWDYNGVSIQSSEVRRVTLSLIVDPDCPALSSFGFDLVIIGY